MMSNRAERSTMSSLNLFLPTILPLATLVLATATFGDEIEDRTLPYLVLKPITRLRIVIEKALAAIAVSAPIIGFGVILTWVLSLRVTRADNTDILWASLAAVLVGVSIYTCVFQLISLLIRRAILASIIYSLVWETVLGRFIAGLALPVDPARRFVGLHLGAGRSATGYRQRVWNQLQSIVAAAIVCAITIALSTWRLRKINIE